MQSIWKSKGKKLHTRTMEVSTYDCDGQQMIVEGSLRDERFQTSYSTTGETYPGGVIHHMTIRLLVNCSNLMIEDVDCEQMSVPREACRETIGCLAPIKGLTITKGFTAKVKKLVGGNKGCAHLVELLLAMAPAAFQGYGAHQSQKPANFNPERAQMVLQYLVNTCHVWREGGPFVEKYKKKLNMK